MREKTNAKKAEEALNRFNANLGTLPETWAYLDKTIQTSILDCTIREIEIYWNTETYLRPHFKLDQDHVTIPTVFAKLNGSFTNLDAVVSKRHEWTFKYTDDSLGNFRSDDVTVPTREGLENKLSILKPELQAFVLQTFDRLSEPSDTAITLKDCDNYDALFFQAICKVSDSIWMKYNQCDLQFKTLRLVFDLSYEVLKVEDIIAITLLNQIGCDVIVINHECKADMEHYVSSQYLCTHYVQTSGGKKGQRKLGKPLMIASVVLLILLGPKIMTGGLKGDTDHSLDGGVTAEMIEVLVEAGGSTPVSNVEAVEHTPAPVNQTSVTGLEALTVTSQVPSSYTSVLFRRFPQNVTMEGLFQTKLSNDFNKHQMTSVSIEVYDTSSFDEAIYQWIPKASYQIGQGLKTGLYHFKSYADHENSRVIYTRIIPVDGSLDSWNISTDSYYTLDLLRSGSNDSVLYFGFRDSMNNTVHFLKNDGTGYYQSDIELLITNKESKLQKVIGLETLRDHRISPRDRYGNPANLPDGAYTVELYSTYPFQMYDFYLTTQDFVIINGKFYFDRSHNQDAEVISQPLRFRVNEGDIYILNMEKIFSDPDGDPLFYDVTMQDFDAEYVDGFQEHLYVGTVRSSEDFELTFYATDMYGKTVEKIVRFDVTDENLGIESFR